VCVCVCVCVRGRTSYGSTVESSKRTCVCVCTRQHSRVLKHPKAPHSSPQSDTQIYKMLLPLSHPLPSTCLTVSSLHLPHHAVRSTSLTVSARACGILAPLRLFSLPHLTSSLWPLTSSTLVLDLRSLLRRSYGAIMALIS
jgi:hypothetical protein